MRITLEVIHDDGGSKTTIIDVPTDMDSYSHTNELLRVMLTVAEAINTNLATIAHAAIHRAYDKD